MKRFIIFTLFALTFSAGFLFAEASDSNPYDKLVENLVKDIDEDEGLCVGVKLFKTDGNEKVAAKMAKGVQMALYESGKVDIVESKKDADLICTGSVTDKNEKYYQLKVNLLDAETNEVLYSAKRNIEKTYAEKGLNLDEPAKVVKKAESEEKSEEKEAKNDDKGKETTIIVKEDTVDAVDVLGAIIVADWFFDILDWSVPHPRHHKPRPPRPAKRPPRKAPPPKR